MDFQPANYSFCFYILYTHTHTLANTVYFKRLVPCPLWKVRSKIAQQEFYWSKNDNLLSERPLSGSVIVKMNGAILQSVSTWWLLSQTSMGLLMNIWSIPTSLILGLAQTYPIQTKTIRVTVFTYSNDFFKEYVCNSGPSLWSLWGFSELGHTHTHTKSAWAAIYQIHKKRWLLWISSC